MPSDDEQKLQHLIRLGSHFWPPQTTPAQAKERLRDYIEDLAAFRVAEIEQFCREWRADVSRKAFPKVSEVIAAVARTRREIKESAAARDRPKTGIRPTLWWMQTKNRWNPAWREAEVPAGEMIRDTLDSSYRLPEIGA